MIPKGMRLGKSEVYADKLQRKLTLAPQTEAGLVPCPGEVHTNVMIDGGCMTCLGGTWGKVMSYKPPSLTDVRQGYAVPCGRIGMKHTALRDEFEAAASRGEIQIVMVETRNSSYFCWVKK